MHAITLHEQGHSIHILEQCPTETPSSHMAGVCLGPDVLAFLSRFDRVAHIPLGIPATQLQSLDHDGKSQPFLRIQRIMSSWDALYYRLRANYDGLASEFVPEPPSAAFVVPEKDTDPARARARARYEFGQRVIDISEVPSTGQLSIVTESTNSPDVENPVRTTLTADLVLGADGPNSTVRQIFLPDPVPKVEEINYPRRRYAGYVAWRGVVHESLVSTTTQQVFQANVTYNIRRRATDGSHLIVYHIPGPAGSITPGDRYLNLCWYQNIDAEQLPQLMTDIHGVQHHTSVGPGLLPTHRWEAQRTLAARLDFPAPYREILSLIDSPFLHLITDYPPPEHTSFLGGRVRLVGDAATFLRPHIAFSTNQAAGHAALTERLISLVSSSASTSKQSRFEDVEAEWEYRISQTGELHWARSIWFGDFFQNPSLLRAVWDSALRYWRLAAVYRVRYWFGWVDKPVV